MKKNVFSLPLSEKKQPTGVNFNAWIHAKSHDIEHDCSKKTRTEESFKKIPQNTHKFIFAAVPKVAEIR